MGRSLTKFSSWQPLLNKHGTVWWKPKGTHSLIFIRSPSSLIPFSLFVISELRSIYQNNFSCIYFPQIPPLPLFFFPPLCLSYLWHSSISAPINFSLLQDSTVSSVPFPVSQTPAQTNIVFNARLLVMNPAVDLAHDPCWQLNMWKARVYPTVCLCISVRLCKITPSIFKSH